LLNVCDFIFAKYFDKIKIIISFVFKINNNTNAEMETTTKKNIKKTVKQKDVSEQKPKSKITLFREKYPEGIGHIVNMRAVLR